MTVIPSAAVVRAAPSPSAVAGAAGGVRLPSPLPLDPFTMRRLERLEQLAGRGRPVSWGWGLGGVMFVDVGVENCLRFEGASLNAAIGAAMRSLGGGRP